VSEEAPAAPDAAPPEEPQPPPSPPEGESPPPAAPDDADDLRGYHFRRLMAKPATWGVTLSLAVAAGVAGAILAGAAIGGGAALLVLLVALIVVFAIADSRSEEAFFEYYALQRGLSLGGRSPLPAATPLLRKGDDRYAERTLTGALADGVDGMLALYTYEDETTDSDGNRQTNYYRYTIGLVDVPECARFMPELFAQRKFGLHALEKLEDVFRRDKERVKLESEALDDKYEIFVKKGQDPNWVRQLFSPTFIVWMTDASPDKFAFEMVDGALCCYVHNHRKKAAELDGMRAATAEVATRLREESTE
jgi:hypothetical protein